MRFGLTKELNGWRLSGFNSWHGEFDLIFKEFGECLSVLKKIKNEAEFRTSKMKMGASWARESLSKTCIIEVSLQQLKKFRSDGSSKNPKLLERDIKIMEWVLNKGEETCAEFLAARYHDGSARDRLDVIKSLGWKIPDVT